MDWQARALKLRGDLGYVAGTVLHHWHGRKAAGKYWDRCKILTDTQFDPSVDLKRDWQGLYQLVDHGERPLDPAPRRDPGLLPVAGTRTGTNSESTGSPGP